MLSNAYFPAKFRFDTAENGPAKNLQKFCKFWGAAAPDGLRAHDLRRAVADELELQGRAQAVEDSGRRLPNLALR